MDRALLELLLPLVNDPYNEEALKAYANYWIERHRIDLERETNPHSIGKLQGQISELRKLLTLRDYVNAEAKRK